MNHLCSYGILTQTRFSGSIKNTALNAIKEFIVVNLFSIVPMELYKLAVPENHSYVMIIKRRVVKTTCLAPCFI